MAAGKVHVKLRGAVGHAAPIQGLFAAAFAGGAIRAGKVMPGMTKEQAIVALGYPRTDLTQSTDLPRWSYRTRSDIDFTLVWGADDRLIDVEAPPDVRTLVVYAP